MKLVILALTAAVAHAGVDTFYTVPGSCTWQPAPAPLDPPGCLGSYDCDGCGVNCGCTDGGHTTDCVGIFSPLCTKGAPTCETAGPGKCDVCSGPFPTASQYGCTECTSDNDCKKHKRGRDHYPKYCFPKMGKCGGECAADGFAACAGLYNGTKPVCIDLNGDGGWCHECANANLKKTDKDYCDKKGTTLTHEKKPFCLKDLSCGSCSDVFKASGKCPTGQGFHNYAQVCVPYGGACFALPDAPCNAFSSWGIAGCPRHRKGGARCTWNSKKRTCEKK